MATLWRMIDPLLSARSDGMADAEAGVPSTWKIASFRTSGECREYGLGHLQAWAIRDGESAWQEGRSNE